MIDLDADRDCCAGASGLGIRHCTCWTETLDQPQAPWNGDWSVVRSRCCGDCASGQVRGGRADRAGHDTVEMG